MIELKKSFHEKVSNIKKLTKYMGNVSHVATKAQAIMLIGKFRDGVIHNALGLEPLKDSTIESKRRNGFTKPSTPLYGLGRRGGDRSYINMFNIRKIKDGYSVYPSRRKHHDSDLTLQQLYSIHEFGATIMRAGTLIRIPPRPAMAHAYDKFQQASIRKTIIDFVRRAIKMGLSGDFMEAKKFEGSFNDWDEYDG